MLPIRILAAAFGAGVQLVAVQPTSAAETPLETAVARGGACSPTQHLAVTDLPVRAATRMEARRRDNSKTANCQAYSMLLQFTPASAGAPVR